MISGYKKRDIKVPLYINNDEVNELAGELQRLTKARSKAAAVRAALVNEIARNKAAIPLRQRLAAVKQSARAAGLPNRDFDQKKFSDDMWGE